MIVMLVGVVIGLVLGLTGAGGSVFAVPLLMLLLDLPATQAMGLALAAVALSASYGVAIRVPQRQFLFLPAMLLSLTGVLAAPPGKYLATLIDEPVLLAGFAMLAVLLAIRMWLQARQLTADVTAVRAVAGKTPGDERFLCRFSSAGNFELNPRCVFALLFFGLLIGFLSGLFGVGGGFIIVPVLLWMSSMTMQTAVGTSLLIIMPVSFSGFIAFCFFEKAIDLESFLFIGIGGLLGMTAGSLLSRIVAGKTLQQGFAVLLIAVVLVTVSKRLTMLPV